MSHETDAAAYAAWWISHRLLSKLVEKGLLTRADAIEVLQQGIDAYATGGPANRSAAIMLEQVKTFHQKAAGLRSN